MKWMAWPSGMAMQAKTMKLAKNEKAKCGSHPMNNRSADARRSRRLRAHLTLFHSCQFHCLRLHRHSARPRHPLHPIRTPVVAIEGPSRWFPSVFCFHRLARGVPVRGLLQNMLSRASKSDLTGWWIASMSLAFPTSPTWAFPIGATILASIAGFFLRLDLGARPARFSPPHWSMPRWTSLALPFPNALVHIS